MQQVIFKKPTAAKKAESFSKRRRRLFGVKNRQMIQLWNSISYIQVVLEGAVNMRARSPKHPFFMCFACAIPRVNLLAILTKLAISIYFDCPHGSSPKRRMSGGESESRSRFPTHSIFKRNYLPKLCRLFENDAAFLASVGFLKMTRLF
jgi:hypothetical protein